MSTPKIRILLRVGFSSLVCAALLLSGCARFDGVVDFAADHTSGKAPLSVQFTPVVEGSVRRYVWGFGDGHTSTERSPEHTYMDAGAYTVILTIDPRRGEPTSARKEGYVTVTAGGFGSPPLQLVVQDDEFELGGPYGVPGVVNLRGNTVYALDVLENDVPADGAAGLTIIGVSAYGDDYDDFECDTDAGIAMVNRDGTAIEYESLDDSSDTFYYLATDGRTTAEGEVWISSGGSGEAPAHFAVRDDSFVIGGTDGVAQVWNPEEGTCYELDVLENDSAGTSSGLTIIAITGFENYLWRDSYTPTEQGWAYISPDGKAIHYQTFDYDQPFDTVYYRATDGRSTAEGEVNLTFDLGWYDD